MHPHERDRLQLMRRPTLKVSIQVPKAKWIARKLERKVVDRILPDPDFYETLNNILPQFRCGHRTPPKRLRDAEVDKVTKLLELWGRPDWSLLPKTFVILYATGLQHHMEAFVRDDRSDICLPYTNNTLPDALTGDSRARFLDYQQNLLTTRAIDGAKIESGQSKHLNLSYNALERHFHYQRLLGQGGFGEVHHVIGKESLDTFALKTISRDHFDDPLERRSLHVFQNELNALQALSHQHVVKLVGSYTDPTCIGLLMKPVADEDLSEFMRKELPPRDQNDRRLRIRTFFGCLAIAINYLHNNETNRVQHKDLNPRNILVKGLTVYIADFGTARLKSDGSSDDTTEPTLGGTFRMMTRKYAPAEAFGGTRTYASDIWSLGCVYLEMATLLARRDLKDLSTHLNSNGTGLLNYWENPKAIAEWITALRRDFQNSDNPGDSQLMDVIQAMCQPDRCERLTAGDLVRRISKLDGAYHGLCCSRRSRIQQTPQREENRTTTDHEREEESNSSDSSESSESSDSTASNELAEFDTPDIDDEATSRWTPNQHGHEPHYAAPVVEDTENTILISNIPPKQPSILLEDVTERWRPPQAGEEKAVSTISPTGREDETPSLEQKPFAQSFTTQRNNGDEVHTEMPKIKHDPVPKMHGQQHEFLCLWPKCPLQTQGAPQLFKSATLLQRHLRETHDVHDLGKTCLFDGRRDDRRRQTISDDASGAFRLLGIKDASFPTRLPGNGRMVNTDPLGAELERPSDMTLAKPTDVLQDLKPKPSASASPSLLLASMKKASNSELESHKARFGRPLFVYGTLMLPSVLHSRSKAFTGEEGTYSSEQGRRLRTTSRDWNGADVSIRAAADSMRPATLLGYDRVGHSSRSCKTAQICQSDSEGSHTNGMIVLGLSEEALACLDHLFERLGPRHLFDQSSRSPDDEWRHTMFQRQNVTVSVKLPNGESVNVEAQTYTSDEFQPGDGEPWNLGDFLRSRSFNKLTNQFEGGVGIIEEEGIAQSLGVRLLLPGDHLVEVVLQGDRAMLKTLLEDEQVDVDGLSARHGTALQAAASIGDLSAMRSLLNASASVNIVGGQYSTALIAAVVEGHFRAVNLLLQHNAKVFAPAGQYISAIYQAVDFDRLDIAHALLEKGAWLTKDYGELLDLADEHDDDEMWDELVRYDVLDVHRKRRKQRPVRRTPEQTRKTAVDAINKTAGFVCLWEAVKLHNQPGKWTGIKGVAVLRAGLDHGLPESVLESIRPFVHSFPSIQKFFVDAVGDRFGGRLLPVQHSAPRSERTQRKRRERQRSE